MIDMIMSKRANVAEIAPLGQNGKSFVQSSQDIYFHRPPFELIIIVLLVFFFCLFFLNFLLFGSMIS